MGPGLDQTFLKGPWNPVPYCNLEGIGVSQHISIVIFAPVGLKRASWKYVVSSGLTQMA